MRRQVTARVTRLAEFSLIGLIFAYWANVYFGQILENYTSSPNVWAIVYHSKSYALILTKSGLGYILGNMWPNPFFRQN
jgi:hypothetical protein